MTNARVWRSVSWAVLLVLISVQAAVAANCGGVERWAVKMGSDQDADDINIDTVITSTIAELNGLPDPRSGLAHGDNTTRLTAERKVYKATGFLRLFKFEADRDFHLVITDSSLRYSKGGSGTTTTGTSFVAEIADPRCFMGKKGTVSRKSRWDAQLADARHKFDVRFPGGEGDDDLMKVPVTITGVAFFDRDHGQTGRAKNGFEMHPVLEITFDDEATPLAVASTTSPTRNLLTNSGFEEGETGWRASNGVIEVAGYPQAADGDGKAVLGRLGRKGERFLSQNLTVPTNVSEVTLTYRLRVSTGEPVSPRTEVDKLYVQIRKANGEWIETIKKHSNVERSRKYKAFDLDLTKYKGQSIRVHFKSVEDADTATSFYLDDVEVRVK